MEQFVFNQTKAVYRGIVWRIALGAFVLTEFIQKINKQIKIPF